MNIISKVDKLPVKLKKYLGKKIQFGDDIYIFGYNDFTKRIMEELKEKRYVLSGILDNGKAGMNVDSMTIRKPKEALKQYNTKVKIIIASGHYRSMTQEILDIDRRYKKNIIIVDKVKNDWMVKWEDNISRCIPNVYNSFRRTFGYAYFTIAYRKEYELVKRNRKFKDIHKGQRCFILGNGPSLNKINPKLLENEIIFGTNQIMDSVIWDKIHVKYWACMDGSFFNKFFSFAVDDFYKKILDMKDIVSELFVFIDYRSYMEKHKIDKEMSVNYICHELRYNLCDADYKSIEEIQLDRFGIGVWNVVLFCIEIAVYMGFSEIYLLGCDQTVVYNLMQKELRTESEEQHVHMKDNDISNMVSENRVKQNGLIPEMRNEILQRNQYRLMQEYCDKRKIILRNLTDPTTLVEVKHGSFSDIQDKKFESR